MGSEQNSQGMRVSSGGDGDFLLMVGVRDGNEVLSNDNDET